ncbi:MAG: cysteine protease StiP family protein [Bacillota bacterium]
MDGRLFEKVIPEPTPMGSYDQGDVVFLLKDLSHLQIERDTEDREEAIQKGRHYSEMLPIEYKPSQEYMDLFYKSLEESSEKLAAAVGVSSEKILQNRGKDIVLVSLARAGTPIGILMKRYIKYQYGMDIPHYSVSIIRGKGIDENAIRYIVKHHPDRSIQFVDGWTGKGAITMELTKACQAFEEKYGIHLDDDLAVLADPGHCVRTFGTREDFLIASACLNATVSGLMSRTVHRKDLIGEDDFHGAKYYKELEKEDVSNFFIDTITDKFPLVEERIRKELQESLNEDTTPTWKGLHDIEKIQKEFHMPDINLIKPGIGETTRVLLRRVPWKILIREEESPNLAHILLLARDRNVTVEVYPHMTYLCCGLICPIKGE